MLAPLDAAHKISLATSLWGSAMIAAIEAAGIVIENNSIGGWQATDAVGAQAIIDAPAAWLPFAKGMVTGRLKQACAEKLDAGRSYAVPGDVSGAHAYQIDEVAPTDPATGLQLRQSS